MVAGDDGLAKVVNALVSKWPEPIDMENDIFLPGKVEKFLRELTSALRTRKLYSAIREKPPSLLQMVQQNPNDDVAVLVEVFDSLMDNRVAALSSVADNLPSVIKYNSLSMSDQLTLNTLASAGDGVGLYDFILQQVDITSGKAQDKLRDKFVACTLSPSDSLTRVVAQIDLKWWLFKHNLLYCAGNTDTRNDLEGVRMILRMLVAGPAAFSMQASLELTSISSVTVPDGTAWIKTRTDHIKRFGDELMKQFSGSLHTMQPPGQSHEYGGDNSNPQRDAAIAARAAEKAGMVALMSDYGHVVPDKFYADAGFTHDVNKLNSCCNVKGCAGPMCIIKSNESVSRDTKWDKLRVGWLVQFLRDHLKQNPTFNFKSVTDYRTIGWANQNPSGKGGGKGAAKGARGSGARGRGGGRGQVTFMFPSVSSPGGESTTDALLASLCEMEDVEQAEQAAWLQHEPTTVTAGHGRGGRGFNAVMTGALCMFHPAPVESVAQQNLSNSGSSNSSDAPSQLSRAVGAGAGRSNELEPASPQAAIASVRQRRARERGVDGETLDDGAMASRHQPQLGTLAQLRAYQANLTPTEKTTTWDPGVLAPQQLDFCAPTPRPRVSNVSAIPVSTQRVVHSYVARPWRSFCLLIVVVASIVMGSALYMSVGGVRSVLCRAAWPRYVHERGLAHRPRDGCAFDVSCAVTMYGCEDLSSAPPVQNPGQHWKATLEQRTRELDDRESAIDRRTTAMEIQLNRLVHMQQKLVTDTDESRPESVALPMVELTREGNDKLPVISIGDGDHKVNKFPVSVMVRKHQGVAEAYDKANSSQQDVLNSMVGDPILAKLRKGRARGLHVAIECKSFSPVAEQVRSVTRGVRGMPDLTPAQQRRVDEGNEFADWCVDALWSAFKGGVSFTAEFQQWRGDVSEPPEYRVYWPEKADYPTLIHFPRIQALIEASGAEIIVVWFCMLGGDAQQVRAILAWPKVTADRLRHLSVPCNHSSHTKLLVGPDAHAGRVYPEVVAESIALAHLVDSDESELTLGFLANMSGVRTNLLRALMDNGASECFMPDDYHCIPGTEGPPTVASVGVGKAGTVLIPQKSCQIPIRIGSRIITPRWNVADVPMAIMSEGYMIDEYRATFLRGPDMDWTMTIPGEAPVRIDPGPGRLNRLGFTQFEVAPPAAAFLMQACVQDTLVDLEPYPEWLTQSNGMLLVTAVPSHVHFQQPKFTPDESYWLAHSRRLHPANSVMVATHDPALTVGHNFAKMDAASLGRACKLGCSVCNAAFMQAHHKGGSSERPSKDVPMGVLDQFGPVRVASIYHGYYYANTSVEATTGWIVTGGSVGSDEQVLEELCNEMRAEVRPWVGEIAVVRTDMMKQTSISRRWNRYKNSDPPFVSQNATGHKHNPVGLVEIVHKLVWPRVLAGLLQQRRGLEWWYVVWRYACLMVNTDATRRDGESRTSRWLSIFGVPYNMHHDRVILSPCQYYLDKEMRHKETLHASNGLWCGFSPFNKQAAWIFTGKEFITVDHGDVRVNEWIAWSLTPVGAPHPNVFDANGDFLLFTDKTEHRSVIFEQYPKDAVPDPVSREVAIAPTAPLSAAAALAQRLLRAHGAPPGRAAQVEGGEAVTDVTAMEIEADVSRPTETIQFALEPEKSVPPIPSMPSRSLVQSKGRVAPAVQTRAAAREASRGVLNTIFADASALVREHGGQSMSAAAGIDAHFAAIDAVDVFNPQDDVAEQLGTAFGAIAANHSNARQVVDEAIAAVEQSVERALQSYAVPQDEQQFLMSLADLDHSQYEALYVLHANDKSDNDKLALLAVPFLGGMVTLYDGEGRTYQVDEPEGWKSQLRSKWRDDWDLTILTEVTKLEDAATWIRVPPSMAAGHTIHRLKPVFVVKSNHLLQFDKRKFRLVVLGQHMVQGIDYLEHYSCGCDLATLRAMCITVVSKSWIRFKFDVVNAFPQVSSDRPFFIHLPEHPMFDWRNEQTGVKDIGLVQGNWYGIPPAPRTFTKQFHAHLTDTINGCGLTACMVQHNLMRRDGPNDTGIVLATYVDEAFGGASDMDTIKWLESKIKLKFPIEMQLSWEPMLGFGVDVDEDAGTCSFHGKKYIQKLVDQFLPGESKPSRQTASRESIMQLPAVQLPPVGSDDDIALHPIQVEARSLGGGLAHLARVRVDIAFEHSWISQGTARPTADHLEHFKEVLRFAWATASHVHVHQCRKGLKLHESDEPIRPFDTTLPSPRTATMLYHSAEPLIEYGLYAMLDAAQAIPGVHVVNSKSMGGLAIMLGAAAIDWKAWRFHTVVVDSASAEMLATSRAVSRVYYFRRVMLFLGVDQSRPTPVLCDNDAVWSIARDATGTTSLTYILRHCRFVQQAQEEKEVMIGQIDGRINPTDGLTKWTSRVSRMRDNLFLMGFALEAYKLWIASKPFKQFVPRKIVPPPSPAPNVSSDNLPNNVRVTKPMQVSREEFEAAAARARKGTPAALPGDDAVLSHAVSRGVAPSG